MQIHYRLAPSDLQEGRSALSVQPNTEPALHCDPEPVECIRGSEEARALLVCEHAGNAIPSADAGLGLSDEHLSEHIAIDIGAAGLCRSLADRLDAFAVLQRYSRLFIDCNRPVFSDSAILASSDGVVVPGNIGLGEFERERRAALVYEPFHDQVESLLDTERILLAVSIHSFTPVLDGVERPWDLGLIFRKHSATAHAMCDYLAQHHPELVVGMNEPYQIDDESDWFVPHHGERRGLPHCLIEVRNDHVRDHDRDDGR